LIDLNYRKLLDVGETVLRGGSNANIGDALAKKKQQSPQYDFLWRVDLPSLNPMLNSADSLVTQASRINFSNGIGAGLMSVANVISSVLGGVMVNPDDINHRVMTFDTPFFQLDTKKVTNKNSFWYTASNNDIGSISFTIHEMEDGKTLQYLDAWKSLIINADGTYNPPVFYKRPVRFYRLSASKLDLHEYIYEGFFISEISTMSNSYEDNGITTYSVTLTGDSVQYNFLSGAEVRSKITAKELAIMGKSWVGDNTKLSGSGLQNVLRTASGIADLVI